MLKIASSKLTLVIAAAAEQEQQVTKWRLVFQQHRRTYLYTLDLSSMDTGAQVMQKIKSSFENIVPRHHWAEWLHFKRLVLETASLTTVSQMSACPSEIIAQLTNHL